MRHFWTRWTNIYLVTHWNDASYQSFSRKYWRHCKARLDPSRPIITLLHTWMELAGGCSGALSQWSHSSVYHRHYLLIGARSTFPRFQHSLLRVFRRSLFPDLVLHVERHGEEVGCVRLWSADESSRFLHRHFLHRVGFFVPLANVVLHLLVVERFSSRVLLLFHSDDFNSHVSTHNDIGNNHKITSSARTEMEKCRHGTLSIFLPSFLSPFHVSIFLSPPFLSLPSISGSSPQIQRLGERCELPQRVRGSPTDKNSELKFTLLEIVLLQKFSYNHIMKFYKNQEYCSWP